MADQTTDFLNFLNDQLNTRVASNEAIFQPTSDGFFTITDGLPPSLYYWQLKISSLFNSL